MSMDSKQFAWLYLIENGNAGCKHVYLGGLEFNDDVKKKFPKLDRWNIASFNLVRDAYKAAILAVGVDWKKTTVPQSDTVSEFAGTFSDPSSKEYISGMLVLKDGSKQRWDAEALEVTSVFDMMAAASEAPAKFKAIFGE